MDDDTTQAVAQRLAEAEAALVEAALAYQAMLDSRRWTAKQHFRVGDELLAAARAVRQARAEGEGQ